MGQGGVTGIVLAGGKSRRMGQDKALMIWNGKPLAQYSIEALRLLVDDLIVVSDHSAHDALGVRRIADLMPHAGPLGGLYTGLNHSSTEDNLVLSCDAPLVNVELLCQLLVHSDVEADIVQLAYGGRANPLIARYRKRCAPMLYALLQQGERRLQTALKSLRVATITADEETAAHMANVNTIEQFNAICHATDC